MISIPAGITGDCRAVAIIELPVADEAGINDEVVERILECQAERRRSRVSFDSAQDDTAVVVAQNASSLHKASGNRHHRGWRRERSAAHRKGGANIHSSGGSRERAAAHRHSVAERAGRSGLLIRSIATEHLELINDEYILAICIDPSRIEAQAAADTQRIAEGVGRGAGAPQSVSTACETANFSRGERAGVDADVVEEAV